jgi:hypothetical protein
MQDSTQSVSEQLMELENGQNSKIDISGRVAARMGTSSALK